MLRFILFRFWPVLIPLVVYMLWHRMVCRRAEKAGKERPDFRDGPWYWAVLSSLLIALLCFLILGMSQGEDRGTYVPPHMDHGKLVPAEVEHKP